MEQNLPVQDQSLKSDREPEEEAEDAALSIDEEDSRENLENHLIPEPQQLSLSKTMQIDTGEPLAKKPKLYEDFFSIKQNSKGSFRASWHNQRCYVIWKTLKNATKNSSTSSKEIQGNKWSNYSSYSKNMEEK